MRRFTSGDILDQFEGDLKFCTDWLHLDGSHGWLYERRDIGILCGSVGCTDLLREHFLIPRKVQRIAFVFTTEPNCGDSATRVRECYFRGFTRAARAEAMIGADPQGDRLWYWHVILDWED